MKNRSLLWVSLLIAVLAVWPLPASSQGTDWKPSGPISMICPHGPGGGFDNWARAISVVLQNHVGVPVVVKNTPGLGGATAMETLWRSKPDGQTIHLFEGAAMISAQHISGFSYDIHKLSFIGTAQITPFAFFVSKASAFNALQDFIKAGKTKALRGGTTGLSSGLWQSMAVFANEAGIVIKPVPGYKSGGDLLVALEAGDFDAMFVPPQTALGSLKRGSVRTLAIGGDSHDPRVPGAPTFAEAGFPGTGNFATVIRALAAPPGTPTPIIGFLEKAFLNTMKDPKFSEWLKSQNDFVEPYDAKKTVDLFKTTDKVVTQFLPILKQYVK